MDDQQDDKRLLKPLAARGIQTRDMFVIGGSAGALDAMLAIAKALPADFAGHLLVVSHIGAHPSHLPTLLSAAGPLPAKHPENGEPIRPGTIYVAPPDRHMLLRAGHIQLSRGPRQHFTRPAIDPLFRTAAEVYGPRVVGVVLSGTGNDGAAGLERIKEAGGVAVVQAPETALFPEMPRSAAAAIPVDYCPPLPELPSLVRRLSSEAVLPPSAAAVRSSTMNDIERPIALTCPDCGGALREVAGSAVKQYRCHIGHGFGAEEIAAGQVEKLEHAVSLAIRVLNERAELCRGMAENANAGGRSLGVVHWRRLQREAEEQLSVLQRFLAAQPVFGAENTGGEAA